MADDTGKKWWEKEEEVPTIWQGLSTNYMRSEDHDRESQINSVYAELEFLFFPFAISLKDT